MSRKNTNKYYIHCDTYDEYAFSPKICILDAVRFFEFNSFNRRAANFYCYASNHAIVEMAVKKAASYNLVYTERQMMNCLKHCKRTGDLIRIENIDRKTGEKRCPMCNSRYIWATRMRAFISDSVIEKKTMSDAKFEEKHPELVDIRNDFVQYLKENDVIVTGKIRKIEKELEKIIEQYYPEILGSYIEYLRSPGYLYQCDHNRYCPRITSISDISGKFGAIREFKYNTSIHFDPNKHLSEQWNR